ncbi:MAG: hypothetical protein HQ519_16935 [Planctomycetes bacterium]|nr:hypothetical protein [Planctomycetota bacterium]
MVQSVVLLACAGAMIFILWGTLNPGPNGSPEGLIAVPSQANPYLFIGLIRPEDEEEIGFGTISFTADLRPQHFDEPEDVRNLLACFPLDPTDLNGGSHAVITSDAMHFVHDFELEEEFENDGFKVDLAVPSWWAFRQWASPMALRMEVGLGEEVLRFSGLAFPVMPLAGDDDWTPPNVRFPKSENYGELGKGIASAIASAASIALQEGLSNALFGGSNKWLKPGNEIGQGLFHENDFSENFLGNYHAFYYSKGEGTHEEKYLKALNWVAECPIVNDEPLRLWIYSDDEEFEQWLVEQEFPRPYQPRIFRKEFATLKPFSNLPDAFILVSEKGEIIWEGH